MKERRKAGATHSFRLTRDAADLVDNINHPRRLGGKSRKVSEAIVAYFGTSKHGGMPSYEELVQNVAALQNIILKNSENDPPSRGYLTRIIAKIRRLVPFL